MRFAVFFGGDGGRHVDDSFDQFRLIHLGHRFVAAFELIARQPVTVAQRRNAPGRTLPARSPACPTSSSLASSLP